MAEVATIDTYDFATMGYNDGPFAIATLGWLDIEIFEIPDEDIDDGGGGGAAAAPDVTYEKEPDKKKKKYKIRVTATIDGEKYVEEKYVTQMKKPEVSDVSVDVVNEGTKPKLNIKLLEE